MDFGTLPFIFVAILVFAAIGANATARWLPGSP
jgi:hypothetical protein